MTSDGWSLDECIHRGSLPTGEPIEGLYGPGPWSDPGGPELPPVTQCHVCNGEAWDLGNTIDCENCGEILTLEEKTE